MIALQIIIPRDRNIPMPKKRLMTPGPTQVPEAARLAMAREVIHHRSTEFKAIMAEVLDRPEGNPARPTAT